MRSREKSAAAGWPRSTLPRISGITGRWPSRVLRPDLAATLGAERFLREIDVAARLQHSHILPLDESGEADGFLYYVMPFVEGRSLRDRLNAEGELPVSDTIRILRDVVDALTEAHAHGVVHRDIKPENILLRGRHALVTDFGVAKAIIDATGRERLLIPGLTVGQDRLYLTIAEYESDIWVVDLEW